MWFLNSLAQSIIIGIVSAPIMAFLSFLIYRVFREIFRNKFYKALFSALGTNDPKDMERYRLKNYVKHTFILENPRDEDAEPDEVFSYRQLVKKVKTTKFVILTGSAGIGKSKLMQRLALQFRSPIKKGTSWEKLANYGILFYKLAGDETVEAVVSRIKADIGNSQVSYSLFLDGLDEMSGLHENSGDEILKTLIRTLHREVSAGCNKIFISLRPEILGKGYSFSEIIPEVEIATFKLRNFDKRQILEMYRKENRKYRSKKRAKITAKKRRENIGKLKFVIQNNPESVFSYPLILTWANEILSGRSIEELQYISWYDALGEVIDRELEREYRLYCITTNSDYHNDLCLRFIKEGKEFLMEIALTMALANEKRVTETEALGGNIAKQLREKYGKTTLVARHLLHYIDWSEKEGLICYEFLHNTIYWRALAEALLSKNTPQDVRAKIILNEAKNKFSTPLLQYCHQGLWLVCGKECFSSYRDYLAYMRAIAAKSIMYNTSENTLPLEVILSCCYGFNEVNFDYSVKFDSAGIREFVETRKLNLSYANIADLGLLKCFGDDSFDVLDCSLSHIVNALIPNYVKEINFRQCTSLRSVTLPDDSRLSKIGEQAFISCTLLTSVVLSNSVKNIGKGAFQKCTSLKSIEIPNSVETIGELAFSICTSLTSVVISNGVKSIERAAFAQCTSLTSIVIPNSVKNIGKYAFSFCASLTRVGISDGVESIGESAFQECTSLKSIEIPGSVEIISESAFQGCASLTNVVISQGVKSIEKGAFGLCFSLTSIVIPNSIKRIEINLASCFALERVVYSGTMEEWDKIEKERIFFKGADFFRTKLSEVICKDGSVKIDV